jgi:hypothetical protein
MIHGGVEPDLLGEVIWWSSDDLWRWSFYELVIYLRIAAERSGRPLAASRSPVGLRSQTEGSSLIPATVGVEAPIPATSRMGCCGPPLSTPAFDCDGRIGCRSMERGSGARIPREAGDRSSAGFPERRARPRPGRETRDNRVQERVPSVT